MRGYQRARILDSRIDTKICKTVFETLHYRILRMLIIRSRGPDTTDCLSEKIAFLRHNMISFENELKGTIKIDRFVINFHEHH